MFLSRRITRGSGDRKIVALTFDDGPNRSSLALNRYLAEEGVRATFFVCGANVERCPGIARTLYESGHELGNHTYSHARLRPRFGWKLNLLSRRQIYEEIERTQQIIHRDAGVLPKLFRPPYGMHWFGLAGIERELGLLDIMWTVIGHDWEWTAEQVAEYVLRRIIPGAIICLHDGRDIRPNPDISVTLSAVRLLVPRLKSMGYEFSTVGNLVSTDARSLVTP